MCVCVCVCMYVSEKGIFLRHRFQTGSGAHTGSYQMGTGGPFSGGSAVGT